jgi:deoxycytidylate deaminase
VLVDRYNHIVGTGFNGFPEGMDDEALPLNRPATDSLADYESSKYPWMDHAEENAVANATVDLRASGVTAYITGQPCFKCAKTLRRHGVKKWVVAERHGYAKGSSPGETMNFNTLVERGVSITRLKPNLNWMYDWDMMQEFKELGFIS